MKCPKCKLVTFDHLSKCPRCKTSFDLSRRLTRKRANPNRRIVLRSADSAEPSPEPSVQAESSRAPVDTPVATSAPAEIAPPPGANEPTSAPGASALPVDDVALEAPASGVSLTDLAATERDSDIEVAASARIAELRSMPAEEPEDRRPEQQPMADVPAEEEPTESLSPAASAALSIKERMVRSSQARRKRRPDLATESIDPVLPDWYEPDHDEPTDDVRAGKSAGRR